MSLWECYIFVNCHFWMWHSSDINVTKSEQKLTFNKTLKAYISSTKLPICSWTSSFENIYIRWHMNILLYLWYGQSLSYKRLNCECDISFQTISQYLEWYKLSNIKYFGDSKHWFESSHIWQLTMQVWCL
jgi:hypothetical protein